MFRMEPFGTPRPRAESGEDRRLFVYETDVDLTGHSGHERLSLTRRDLLVKGAYHKPERRWSREQIEAVRLESHIGSCFLQVRADGHWLDVLRCAGKCDESHRALVDSIDRWRGGSSADPTAADGDDAEDSSSAALVPAGLRPAARWHTVRRIVGLMRPFTGMALLLFVLSLVTVAIELAPPILQRVLVDDVLQPERSHDSAQHAVYLLVAIVAGLLFFRVAVTLVSLWKSRVSSRVGTAITANLRDELVRKLNDLPLSFHDRNQVGVLMSRVAYDTETFHTLVHHMTSGLLMQTLQLVGIAVMLFYLNPKLALLTMLPMPLILIGSAYFTRYLNPRHHHYWEAVGKQASALSGMLSGIRVVKAFVQEDRESRRFRDFSLRLRDARQTVDLSTSSFTATMGFLFALGGLAVWYVGGRDVLQDQMTLGSLMAFFGYLAMFYAPLTSISESTTWFSNLFTASQRIMELLDTPGEMQQPTAQTPPRPVEGRIEFDDASFAYQGDRPVLRNLNLTIEPGERVGIVGRSGSGKSTLVNLIAGLYQIDCGRLLIDGVDVREIDHRLLRRHIGMVLQEPFLFRGSVAANLAYGSDDATPEQLMQAARYADAHEFIMRMTFGYDTQLGEGGSGLSGGERQRLSIARAMVFDPKILILDEATASVDAESERAIRDAVWRFSRRRTTISIAHRLSTLRGADRIVVLDQGRLIEQGSPEELLAQGGLYSKLVAIQMNSANRQQAAEAVGAPVDRESAFAAELYGAGAPSDDAIFDNAADEELANGDADGVVPWLDPAAVRIEGSGVGLLRVSTDDTTADNVYALRALPANHPWEYISLRYRDTTGHDCELGLMRALADWPAAAQEAVRRSLERRYLLRRIREIKQVHTDRHGLAFWVVTEGGPARFSLEKPAEDAIPFGKHGLLLHDRTGNLYVVPDRHALPPRQQQLLELYCAE